MPDFKMPARASTDGPMSVTKMQGDVIQVTVETNGEPQTITMSRFNAVRVFATLSLIFGLPLSKAAQKAIRF